MAENDIPDESSADADVQPARPKAIPIDSRFLYVDVAAMRAKQLRRGALVRLSEEDEQHDPHKAPPRKAERIAMEEVRRGLVLYEVVEPKKVSPDA
jgi:DNA-directed RNA polymerase subunit K/omega